MEYANGGYVPGDTALAFIHPDECLMRQASVEAGWVCGRPGHPTATSDCKRREEEDVT